MSHEAVSWVLYQSPMLRMPSGKPDSTARGVLVVYGERADADGRRAFPGPLFVAEATGYDETTVKRAVRRLEAAGLLVRDGTTELGAVCYRLDMSLRRGDEDRREVLDAAARRRAAAAERKRRSRAKQADVTHSESVTSRTQNPAVTHSVPPEPPYEPPGTDPGGATPPDPLRPGALRLPGLDDQPAANVLPDVPTTVDPETHVPPRARARGTAHTERPRRCPHGSRLATEANSSPQCTFCRRGLPGSPPANAHATS